MALALGCTVRELLCRLTARELREWELYYSLEPFGEQRADMRAALIAMTTAQVMGGKKAQKLKLRDFMLYPEPQQEKKQSESYQRNVFVSLANAVKKAKARRGK